MILDKRYITAKKLISGGHLKTFSELLDTIPKTRLATDMSTAPARFNSLIQNPDLFVLKDIFKIAELIGVDDKTVFDLIYSEYLIIKKGKKKK